MELKVHALSELVLFHSSPPVPCLYLKVMWWEQQRCHGVVDGLIGHDIEERSCTSMKSVSTRQAILQIYWASAPVELNKQYGIPHVFRIACI